MKKLLFIILVVLIFLACEQKQDNKVADNPVKEEKPQAINEQNTSEIIEKKKEYVIPELVTTNEINSHIEKITVRPACVRSVNGGEIYYKVKGSPSGIIFQIKQDDLKFQDVFKKQGTYEGYARFAICDACGKGDFKAGDFELKPDEIYVLRVKFNQTLLYGKFEFSNEYLIDTRNSSEYMLKPCKSENIYMKT